MLLHIGRVAVIGPGSHERSVGCPQLDGFPKIGKMSVKVALHEQRLSSGRPGSTCAKSLGIGRDVNAPTGGQDRSRGELPLDSVSQLPSRDIHGEVVRISQFQVFFVLIPTGRVKVDRRQVQRRIALLGQWNLTAALGNNTDCQLRDDQKVAAISRIVDGLDRQHVFTRAERDRQTPRYRCSRIPPPANRNDYEWSYRTTGVPLTPRRATSVPFK